MRPLVSSNGMKEGAANEDPVLRGLDSFLESNSARIHERSRDENTTPGCTSFRLHFLRKLGLICQKDNSFLCDSPDGLCSMVRDNEQLMSCAVEIKTMTAIKTISESKRLAAQYGKGVFLQNVGIDEHNTTLFKKLVPTTGHRCQVAHHATVLGVTNVLFVVAKGGRAAVGEVIYYVMVSFNPEFLKSYETILCSIQQCFFSWVTGGMEDIPEVFKELVNESYASDYESVLSYFGLSKALRTKTISSAKPLPPARMIRPTSLVFWNTLKGGVDVFSRTMMTFARKNSSEHPIARLVARQLSAQVANAGLVYRLILAVQKKKIPSLTEIGSNFEYSYKHLRKKVATTLTSAEFVQRLCVDLLKAKGKSFTTKSKNSTNSHKMVGIMKKRFGRDVIKNFNTVEGKGIRLNAALSHNKILP